MKEILAVARGDQPGDLLLKNAKVVNVLSGEIVETHVALAGSLIAGLGDYKCREELDLEGAYVAPGLIDAHVHIESSLVKPSEFARAVLPRGTTTVVTDPHEIANVLGLEGIRFMLQEAEGSPLSALAMASSCVPATHMETSGAELSAADLSELLDEPRVLGLAEVMNFPGVVHGAEDMLEKLAAFRGRVIDGHCPALTGKQLQAYVAAGIHSDHECTTLEEAWEKLRLGMTVFIREATNAHNLKTLLPLVEPLNHHRICFCTDDRQPADLLDEGHIDHMVRTAIAAGIEPIVALRMATWNPASYFRLRDRGAITPGRRADLFVFRELDRPEAHLVFAAGVLEARDGKMARPRSDRQAPPLPPTMNIDWDRVDLTVPASGSRLRVIGVIPDQLVTENLILEAVVRDGEAVADPETDLLKMAVIERHKASGSTGLGFVRGMGLRRGAVASSVAHDHHNLVVIGADDASMETAARRAAELGGGMVAASGERVLSEVPLPLAGLMSDEPIEAVRDQLDGAIAAARELGSTLHDPFMAMSFLALEVIPSLKLTDQGLVDVDSFSQVPLWAD